MPRTIQVSSEAVQALIKHNQCRDLHGAGPLKYSAALSSDAQTYANELASRGKLAHDHQLLQNLRQGENLAMGHRTASDAVQSFYDEIGLYDYSNPGFSFSTGHFTQLVWKNTTELGIGIAMTSSGQKVYVFRYTAPGNVEGQFRANVMPPGTLQPGTLQPGTPCTHKPRRHGGCRPTGNGVDISFKVGTVAHHIQASSSSSSNSWRWRFYLQPSKPNMCQYIQSVQAQLHPTFGPKPFELTWQEESQRYELACSGWGHFPISYTVAYTSGGATQGTHELLCAAMQNPGTCQEGPLISVHLP